MRAHGDTCSVTSACARQRSCRNPRARSTPRPTPQRSSTAASMVTAAIGRGSPILRNHARSCPMRFCRRTCRLRCGRRAPVKRPSLPRFDPNTRNPKSSLRKQPWPRRALPKFLVPQPRIAPVVPDVRPSPAHRHQRGYFYSSHSSAGDDNHASTDIGRFRCAAPRRRYRARCTSCPRCNRSAR